ncbi:MAG: double-strand break repair helicase AddA [Alphaproteobacteria bacterium]|jgi:ATP-dependent helicase/nuclease subunit A|nr:double-strand break repair helicase AddA [Alphaproteobacteria bacterium]
MTGIEVTRGLAAQRVAADPALSAWVAANAGAGKTKVLTDRVLRLLLADVRPSAILCLTYTKAAAAEMKLRLAHRLGAWAMMPDAELGREMAQLNGAIADRALMQKARQLFATLLDAPGGLAIQTIHSFCGALLQRFPLEAGIAPDFAIADDQAAAELAEAARAGVLSDPDPDLARARADIVALLEETGFASLLDGLIRERKKLKGLVARHGDDPAALIAATAAVLGIDPGDSEAAARQAFAAATDPVDLGRIAAALDCGNDNDRGRCAVLRQWLKADGAGRLAGWADYQSLFLRADGEPKALKSIATKKAVDAEPGLEALVAAEQARLAAVLERIRAARTLARSALLIRLGLAFLARYETGKAARGLLDYDDLILRTRDLLQKPGIAPWVLYKLDGGIDHLLVDEAQDTAPEQWEVVAALVEEFFAGSGAREAVRTVFAVGDRKQSIYSFQGAVPARFEEMRQVFELKARAAELAFEDVALAISFRSAPPVLDLVDRVFAQPAARGGVAEHETVRHIPFRVDQPGRAEIWPLLEPVVREAATDWRAPTEYLPEDNPKVRLARDIGRQVAMWVAGGTDPGDVLILVRRRGQLAAAIVTELKLLGVPVAGADRLVLTEQLAVMDLIALGRFCLLADDDLTLATVLKSPLYGFDDDDLFALCHDRAKARLWPTLRRRAGEQPKWTRAAAELAELLARADFVAPYEFYADLLSARRGRDRLVARLGTEALDPIEEMLEQALVFEQTHAPSLESFLHWLEHQAIEVKRDLDQARGEVRIMTVHGAKGLEAPIVILPDSLSAPDHTHDPRLLWPGGNEPRALIWRGPKAESPRLVGELIAAARDEQMQEYRRLLYVALTRARDRLLVAGAKGARPPAEGCWYNLVAGVAPELVVDPPELAAVRLAATPETPAVGVPAWSRRPPPEEPVPSRPLAPSRETEADPPALSPRLGAQARFRRGRIVHDLLQVLPDLPAADRAAAARRHLAKPGLALAPPDQAALAGEVLAVLENPRFAAVFGPGSRAELPIVGRVGPQVVSGQVDRLVVTESRVLVVDFKTNRPPPAVPEAVARVYLRQMALYRAVLAQVFPGLPVECALIWTDGARLMELPADLLDRVLQASLT